MIAEYYKRRQKRIEENGGRILDRDRAKYCTEGEEEYFIGGKLNI
jgi:hypothetical protein